MLLLFSLKSSSSLLIFLPLGILAPTNTPEILLPFSFKGVELLTLYHLVCICVAEGLGLEIISKNNFMESFLSHSVRLCAHFCHKNTLSGGSLLLWSRLSVCVRGFSLNCIKSFFSIQCIRILFRIGSYQNVNSSYVFYGIFF